MLNAQFSRMTARRNLSVAVEGTALVAGRRVCHEAVPAEDMMQAFFYRHLVPAQELKVAISGRPLAGQWAGARSAASKKKK